MICKLKNHTLKVIPIHLHENLKTKSLSIEILIFFFSMAINFPMRTFDLDPKWENTKPLKL